MMMGRIIYLLCLVLSRHQCVFVKTLSLSCLLWSMLLTADIRPETPTVELLPAPHPHWIWVNDVVFPHAEAGKSFLIDGDNGRMLGMLSTGFAFISLAIPRDYREIYSPETYYSRGTRGIRTDIVAIYDPATLLPVDEIIIPAKRAETLGTLYHSVLTDNDRFLGIFNYTPAQSITIVDVRQRRFIAEVPIPGCALVYPVGMRFSSLCADGSLLTLTLSDVGKVTKTVRSKPFFDPDGDYLSEKAARIDKNYYFVSNEGYVHPVNMENSQAEFPEKWSLFTGQDREESWRTGGIQHLATHEKMGRLYSLMHQGGPETHKDPGNEVWVYDIASRKRIQRISLTEMATSIQISQDEHPLLFTISPHQPVLYIYDALTGKYLRSVNEIGLTPSLLQTPRTQ